MFLLFAYDTYYPSGGWNDFRGAFHTLEEAKAAAPTSWHYENYHIVDTIHLKVIASSNYFET